MEPCGEKASMRDTFKAYIRNFLEMETAERNVAWPHFIKRASVKRLGFKEYFCLVLSDII